jgi:hypothetical protein
MLIDAQSATDQIRELLQRPFWYRLDFWIATVIGVAGLVFSIGAFVEARSAKRAAVAAGRTVKLQTIAIELTEVVLKLDRMQPELRFSEARDLLNDISRHLHRAIVPFVQDPKLSGAITATLEALQAAQVSLKGVRPTTPANEAETPGAVYNALGDNFTTINNLVSGLIGLFEKETSNFGEDDAES